MAPSRSNRMFQQKAFVTIQLICDDGAMELRGLRSGLASHAFTKGSVRVTVWASSKIGCKLGQLFNREHA